MAVLKGRRARGFKDGIGKNSEHIIPLRIAWLGSHGMKIGAPH